MRYLDTSHPITREYLMALAARCKCKKVIVGHWSGNPVEGKAGYGKVSYALQIGNLTGLEQHTRELCIRPMVI